MHAAWTIRAASAGLHVLCEKPLATSVRDCERMIEACERNGVRLMTAYRLHFERCNLEVAGIVRRKRIGDARYFDSQFSMQVKPGNIRLDRELGGGPEWDIGIYCRTPRVTCSPPNPRRCGPRPRTAATGASPRCPRPCTSS